MKSIFTFLVSFIILNSYGQTVNIKSIFSYYGNKDDPKEWSVPRSAYRLKNGKIAAAILPIEKSEKKGHIIIYDPVTKKQTQFTTGGHTSDAYLNGNGDMEIVTGKRFEAYNTDKNEFYHVFTDEKEIAYDKYSRALPDSKYEIYTIDFLTLPDGAKQWWGLKVYDIKADKGWTLSDMDFGFDVRGTGPIDYTDIKTFKNNQYFLKYLGYVIKMDIDGIMKGTAKKDYLWMNDLSENGLRTLKSFHYDAATNSIIALTSEGLYSPKFNKYENGYDQYHIHQINAADGKLRSSKSLLPDLPEFKESINGKFRTQAFLDPNQIVFQDDHFFVVISSGLKKKYYLDTFFLEIIKFDYSGKIITRYPLKTEYDLSEPPYEAGLFQLAENNFLIWYEGSYGSSGISFYEVKI